MIKITAYVKIVIMVTLIFFYMRVAVEGNEECVSSKCHSNYEEEELTGQYAHSNSKNTCMKCHDSHKMQEKKDRTSPISSACYGCHKEMAYVIDEWEYLHEPVKKGQCDSCHKIHRSQYRKLLKKMYPKEYVIEYRSGLYDLCWDCHDERIVTTSNSEVTLFRNGHVNLHTFHINRNKGRACQVCHMIHGSNQKQLLRWTSEGHEYTQILALKGRFYGNTTGGSCEVSCHRRKEYNRQ